MTLEVQATYEDGVLKLDQPLPLKQHERVTVSIIPRPAGRLRNLFGLIRWTGDPETLRRIAEDPEVGEPDSP